MIQHDDHHTRISDIVAPRIRPTRGRDLPGWDPSGFIASRTQVRGRQVGRAGLAAGEHRQPVWRRTEGGSEEGRTSAWPSLPTSGPTSDRPSPAPAAISSQTCGCGSSRHLQQQQTIRVLQHRHQETDHRLDWLDNNPHDTLLSACLMSDSKLLLIAPRELDSQDPRERERGRGRGRRKGYLGFFV